MSLWPFVMGTLPPSTAGTFTNCETPLRNCRKLFDCVRIAMWRRLTGYDGSMTLFGHLIAFVFPHIAQ